MGFTVVPDKANLEVVTETNWDVHIRDNLNTGVIVQLADVVLGVDTASFDLTSISQSWESLLLVSYLRSTRAATSDGVVLRFNNDSGANYDYQHLYGVAGTSAAGEAFAQTSIVPGTIPGASATANLFGVNACIIPAYAQATNNKSMTAQSAYKLANSTGNALTLSVAAFWRSNSAINRITLTPSVGPNFLAGSRVSLYGSP